jgi:transcription-repair coupling factor (superfamily II helicase)
MKEKARKRLKAIEEFTELGSGFHLAMRDLEIRGAGNLLGPQQHGFIEEVGFDLYCRMLEETIAELKNTAPPVESREVKIQSDLDLYIPTDYIDDSNLRVEIYRNISNLDSLENLQSFSAEILDRFGSFPEAINNLFVIAESRIRLTPLKVERLSFKNGNVVIEFGPDSDLSKSDIERWRRNIPENMEFRYGKNLTMKIAMNDGSAETLKKVLRTIAG